MTLGETTDFEGDSSSIYISLSFTPQQHLLWFDLLDGKTRSEGGDDKGWVVQPRHPMAPIPVVFTFV